MERIAGTPARSANRPISIFKQCQFGDLGSYRCHPRSRSGGKFVVATACCAERRGYGRNNGGQAMKMSKMGVYAGPFLLPVGIAIATNHPDLKEGLWSIHTQTIDNPGNKKSDGSFTLCR